MKTEFIQINEPKNRTAALKQYVHLKRQVDAKRKRKENIMNNINSVTEKIKKLQEQLENYQKQIESLDKSSEEFNEILERLTIKFTLTEAEILEVQSSLLRSQIAQLSAEADIVKTGQSSLL